MKRLVCILTLLLAVPSVWALTGTERAVIWTRCSDAVRYHFPGFDEKGAAAWDANFDTNLRDLQAAGSDTEFWRKLRVILATLGDGRTALQMPNGLPRIYDTAPVRFVLAGEKILVKQLGDSPEVSTSGIRVGDELISIEHRPVLDYLRQECLPYVSGSNDRARLAESTWRLLHGPADSPVLLVLHRANGQEYSATLKRNSGPDSKFFRDLTKKKGAYFRKLPGSIAYFDFGQRITSESANALAGLLGDPISAQGIIIDLRETKYGFVPQQALEKLALFPLPMGEYREANWTTSPKLYEAGSFTSQRGTRDVKTQMIEPAADPFRGKVVVLVSPETAGPAEQFLEPLYFADRATLIGDTTAGAGGQTVNLSLDGGGNLSLTVRQPKWEGGNGLNHGFPPKIYAALSAKGLAAGKDDVLERAIDFIRERAD